ncbi:MAG: hypothetical protein JNL83_25735 [Myxococcales bacterium]|nr:hypothetical protein [Myxococcales bacterium]
MKDVLWRALQVWGVPVGMGIAYAMLIWSAETDTTGKAWMTIGYAFVLVIWFVLHYLMTTAALARAIDVGDAAKLMEVSDRNLRARRGDAARAPYLVARGIAHELTGAHAEALAALDEAKLSALPAGARAAWQLRAASTRVAALVGLGKTADARTVLDAELRPDAPHPAHSDAALLAALSAGRVLAAEGKRDAATAKLAAVIDDVRATGAMRSAAKAVLQK